MKPNEILEDLIGRTKSLLNTLVLLQKEQGTLHELDRDSVRQHLREMYMLSGQLYHQPTETIRPQAEIHQVEPEEPVMHVEIQEEHSELHTAINVVLEEGVRLMEPVGLQIEQAVATPGLSQENEITAPAAAWPDEPAIHAGLEVTTPIEQAILTPPVPQPNSKADSDAGKSVAEQFAPSETVGDVILRNQPVQRVSDKLRSTPLSDLHESIGINERFAFINQLFKGDQARYFETINRLNASHSQDEALHFLNVELLPGMAWKTPPAAWKDFIELVSRRYQA